MYQPSSTSSSTSEIPKQPKLGGINSSGVHGHPNKALQDYQKYQKVEEHKQSLRKPSIRPQHIYKNMSGSYINGEFKRSIRSPINFEYAMIYIRNVYEF